MKINSFISNFSFVQNREGLKFLFHLIMLILVVIYIPIAVLITFAPHVTASIHTTTSQYQKDIVARQIEGEAPEIIVLGDSISSSSINARVLPKALSLAGWGSSPLEMSSLLVKYLSKNSSPRCVVIGTHYYSDHITNIEYLDAVFAGRVFDISELIEFYSTSKALNDFPSDKISPAMFYLNIIGYKINFFGNYTRGLTRTLFNYRSEQKRHNLYLESLRSNNGSLARPYFMKDLRADIFVKMNFEKFEPRPIYDFYLKRIADELAKKNVRVEVVFPPISPRKDSLAIRSYKDKLGRHLRSIFNDSNVSFTHYEPPIVEASYFPDHVHMGQFGATEYTKYLMKKGICK